MSQRLRNFVFTINNPTQEDVDGACQLPYSYLILGLEKGDQGTIHIQGYCELTSQLRFGGVTKFLPRAHIECRQGSAQQASDYCKKENNFHEYGKLSKPGHRTDIQSVKELIKSGKGMKEITDEVDSYQAIRHAETYLKYHEKKRDWKPYVVWIYGPTGTGKTRRAMELSNKESRWVSLNNGKFWEGYDAHECVILDDFRGDWCKFHELLRILDRYEYRVEVKGGSRQLLARSIIITSSKSPREVYNVPDEDIEQLIRRIDKVEWLTQRCVTEVGGNSKPLP